MILFHINFGLGIKMVTHVEIECRGLTVQLLYNERYTIRTKVLNLLHNAPTGAGRPYKAMT